MKFQSIEEIRKEFKFDSSLTVREMIKELTQLQKKLHPDVNPNYSEVDHEMFTKADEAIDFLRSIRKQTMVAVSEVVELVKEIINNKASAIEHEDKLSERILNSSERVYKNVKDYYLPKKISLATFAIFTTLFSVIIFFILNNNVFFRDSYLNIDLFYLIISLIWLIIVSTSIMFFVDMIKRELIIKRALNELGNTNLQFKIFKDFINERNAREVFTKTEIEEYVNAYVLDRCFYRVHDKKLYLYITEITPKVTDMIIFRAINKGFISEIKDSWNDKYIFIYKKEI